MKDIDWITNDLHNVSVYASIYGVCMQCNICAGVSVRPGVKIQGYVGTTCSTYMSHAWISCVHIVNSDCMIAVII